MDAFDVILDKIQARVHYLKDTVSSGGMASFDEYQRNVGEVRGLLTAEGYILDLKQTMELAE